MTKTTNKGGYWLTRLRQLGTLLLTCSVLMLGQQAAYAAQEPAPTASAPPSPQTESVNALYLGGTGTSPHIESVLDELTDYLLDHKVAAKQLPAGQGNSRHQLAERVKAAGGQNLLFLSLDTGESQSDLTFRSIRLKAQCITADGQQLWEEEASGVVMATMPTAIKSLIKKMTKKLDARVGKPGLAVSQ